MNEEYREGNKDREKWFVEIDYKEGEANARKWESRQEREKRAGRQERLIDWWWEEKRRWKQQQYKESNRHVLNMKL